MDAAALAEKRAEVQKLLEEYYALDYEDTVGGLRTRCRYKEGGKQGRKAKKGTFKELRSKLRELTKAEKANERDAKDGKDGKKVRPSTPLLVYAALETPAQCLQC